MKVWKRIFHSPDYRPKSYWASRSSLRYYAEVENLARHYAQDARSAIDVGAADTSFIGRLNWIPERVALDHDRKPAISGVVGIQADFATFEPRRTYDLVTCLQVLEHLDDPAAFARKLLAIGLTVIISVPYKWPRWLCAEHTQDPVDEIKLLTWTERRWTEKRVVWDRLLPRLIVVFPGNSTRSRDNP